MKRVYGFLLSCVLLLTPIIRSYACFSIVAGKKATTDGSVLFGHNEDDGGRRVVNVWLVPRFRHGSDEFIALTNGGIVRQAAETWSYFWFQMNGLHFSDYYMNEWGVTIGSNACGSREDDPGLTDGGIGYYLRRIVAERAKTAREGVRIAGDLLDRFGYASSGRTLIICDADEAWLLSMVAGKHWVAQRVPDDKVAVQPNRYIIREVKFRDTDNFMVSKSDIREYAIKRGWYDPGSGKPFDFAAAYNPVISPRSKIAERGYDARQWQGQHLITGSMTPVDEALKSGLPFAVKPAKKVTVKDFADICRDHFENTPYAPMASNREIINALEKLEKGTPPRNLRIDPNQMMERTICTATTQHTIIAQLRSSLPAELGHVLWVSMGRPDCHAFIPWYLGMESIPDGYRNMPGIDDSQEAVKRHFKPTPGTFDYDDTAVFWQFNDLENLIDLNYAVHRPAADAVWEPFEHELISMQSEVEKTALSRLEKDNDSGRRYLTLYTHAACDRVLREVLALTSKLKTDYYR